MRARHNEPKFMISRESDGLYWDGSRFVESSDDARVYSSKEEAEEARRGVSGGVGTRLTKVFG